MQIMALGVVKPEMAFDFGSEEVELILNEGVVHGQPKYYLEIVKTVRVDGWIEIVHVCCLYNIA